jgi:hypothetical protein
VVADGGAISFAQSGANSTSHPFSHLGRHGIAHGW